MDAGFKKFWINFKLTGDIIQILSYGTGIIFDNGLIWSISWMIHTGLGHGTVKFDTVIN